MRVQGYFRILSFFDIGEALELQRLRTLLGPASAVAGVCSPLALEGPEQLGVLSSLMGAQP